MDLREMSLDIGNEIIKVQMIDQALNHPCVDYCMQHLETFDSKLSLEQDLNNPSLDDFIQFETMQSNNYYKSSFLPDEMDKINCNNSSVDMLEEEEILKNVIDPNSIFDNQNKENDIEAYEYMQSFSPQKANLQFPNYNDNKQQLRTINGSDIYNADIDSSCSATLARNGRRRNRKRAAPEEIRHNHKYSNLTPTFFLCSRDNSPNSDATHLLSGSSSPQSQYIKEEYFNYETPLRDSSPLTPVQSPNLYTSLSERSSFKLNNGQCSSSAPQCHNNFSFSLTKLENEMTNSQSSSNNLKDDFHHSSYPSPPYSNTLSPAPPLCDESTPIEAEEAITPFFSVSSPCPSDTLNASLTAKTKRKINYKNNTRVRHSTFESKKRTKRMSLIDFDDEEKQTRIRKQNNRASRDYRKRRKASEIQLQNIITKSEEEKSQNKAKLSNIAFQREVLLNLLKVLNLNDPIAAKS